jgi:hypothetical protein
LSGKRKKALISIGLTLIVLVSILGIIIFSPNSSGPNRFASTPPIIPVLANVELNASEGFSSSQLVEGPNISPLFVLPPGGNGSIPFTVYCSAQVPFNASLSIYLGEANVNTNGVVYSFSPSNFTVYPGQNVTSVLTITADKDAPSAFYSPTLEIQTNKQESPYYISGGAVAIPSLLIGNSVPSCLYIVTEYDITPTAPPMTLPSNVPVPTNASVTYPVKTPSNTPQVPDPFPEPTINMTPGETTTIIFACATQDALNLNATSLPAGFSTAFLGSPLNIIYSGISGNLWAYTVTAGPSITPGNYNVNVEATLGSYPFKCSLQINLSPWDPAGQAIIS